MPIHVSTEIFEDLVRDAIMSLPGKFLMKMENVSVIVGGSATPDQMAENDLQPTDILYGLYEGVPLTERGSYVPPLPDIITIFQNPIEHMSHTQKELENQIAITVRHEVAHFFGFNDSETEEMGLG